MVLAAARPEGRFLELGTGLGSAAVCLLAGMCEVSSLVTVEIDQRLSASAREVVGDDPRVEFLVGDGAELLEGGALAARAPGGFDLVFADAWPGKISHLDPALDLVAPGGLYVIDDLLPQPNWPEGHEHNVVRLRQALSRRSDFVGIEMNWDTGVALFARQPVRSGDRA